MVYQYYCRNLPRPTEPRYPLWQGLPADSTMTPAEVHARLQECTGIDSDPADRTAPQQRNLDDILAVTRVPERALATNLLYATFLFQDIVSRLHPRPFQDGATAAVAVVGAASRSPSPPRASSITRASAAVESPTRNARTSARWLV